MGRPALLIAALGGLVLATTRPALAEDQTPDSMICTCNAKAGRDYAFEDKQWHGGGTGRTGTPFRITTLQQGHPDFPLRDKVFSRLRSDSPVVRSLTPASKWGPEQAAEFQAKVVLRSPDELFLLWSNEINKTWLAVLDLRGQRAVVTQVFRGITSVGGEVETFDCK